MSQTVLLPKIVFWKFVELCEMCCISCCIMYNQMLNATFYSTQNIWWDFSLVHYEGDKMPLNWYRLWNMSCLLRLPTPLPSNFKALFSSRNRLCALSDAILLLAGRCHVGQKRQSPARAWKRVHAGRRHAGRSLRRQLLRASTVCFQPQYLMCDLPNEFRADDFCTCWETWTAVVAS